MDFTETHGRPPRVRSLVVHENARRSMSSLHGSLATTEDSNETASIDLEVYDSREGGQDPARTSNSYSSTHAGVDDARGSRRRATRGRMVVVTERARSGSGSTGTSASEDARVSGGDVEEADDDGFEIGARLLRTTVRRRRKRRREDAMERT